VRRGVQDYRGQVTPRAVIFDWAGTLTPWHEVDARAGWAAFARGYGTLACALNNLTASLVDAEDAARRAALKDNRGSTLEGILRAAGVRPGGVATDAGLAAYWDFWEPHTLTHPAVRPLLASLSEAGVRVGVLANTIWPRSYHEGLFDRDEVAEFIAAQSYSCETGVTKPHPDAFRAVLDQLGVRATDAIYVGDRPYEDIAGAASVGLRTVHLRHRWFLGDEVRPSGAVPTAVVSDLDEVGRLILRW